MHIIYENKILYIIIIKALRLKTHYKTVFRTDAMHIYIYIKVPAIVPKYRQFNKSTLLRGKMTFYSGEYFVHSRLMRVLCTLHDARNIYIIRKTFIHIYYSITRIIKCPGKWYMIYILFSGFCRPHNRPRSLREPAQFYCRPF